MTVALGRVVQSVDLGVISPPLVLGVAAVVALVADLFLPARHRRAVAVVPLVGLLGAVAAAGVLASGPTRRTFCLSGGECGYVADDVTLFFQLLLAAAGVVVVLLSVPAVRETPMPVGEHWFLLLASFTGMLVLPAARDLVTLLVALETVTLPAFVLVGLRRSDPRSAESALKFFLVSVVCTAVSVYGMSLVYGTTGSLWLDRVAAGLAHPASRPLAAAAVVMTLAAFVFKVSVVPFHFWAPDTYQGAPVPVAAFLSVASKAAGFAGLLVLVMVGFRPYADVWGPLLGALAVASMTLGNLVALRQRHMVRLLAWSSVAQAGWILLPLGVGASAGGRSGHLGDAAGATMAYVAIYAAMNLGAFACAVAVGRQRPRNAIDDYRGLARSSPWLAAAFAFFLLCLAGLPPGVAGLFAKVVVLRAVVDGHVTWLAVAGAVNAVLGLAYYLRIATLLYREDAGEAAPRPVGVPVVLAAGLGLAVLATVALTVWPQAVLHATPGAAAFLP